MDNGKKKSFLIRLLGKIGGKVRFLRKPLTVIVVVCVSIHAMFRQLFFDVKYHTVRMRALMGAMCLALLCTLFVIPAIADEVLEGETVVEVTESEEEPTEPPVEEAPIVVEEVPEEPSADQAAPEDETDDTEAADEGDESEGAETPDADAAAPTDADEGTTYDVDDEGNLIDPETGEKVKNETIAARRVNADYPTTITKEMISIKKTISGTDGEVTENDVFEYDYGEVPSGESFTASVKYTDPADSQEKLIPNSELEFKWMVNTDTTPKSTTSVYTVPSAAGLDAGEYEVRCAVSLKGQTSVESKKFKIKVKKAQLTYRNLTYTGIAGTYYVTKNSSDSKIPTNASSDATSIWTGTKGSITAEYKVYNAEGTAEVTDPWKTPGNYTMGIQVTDATNYEASGVMFFEGKPKFSVEYKVGGDSETDKPYTITPVAKGNPVEGSSGLKWYLEDVTLKPKGAYTMSLDDGSSYDALGQTYSNGKDQGPITPLKFMADGIYPLYDKKDNIGGAASEKTYNIGQVFNVDTDAPTGTLNFEYIDENGNPISGTVGDFSKYNVKWSVSDMSDATSGIANDEDHVAYSIKTTKVNDPKTITDWKKGNTGILDKNQQGPSYVYIKLTDNAGTNGYITQKCVTIDTMKPTFKSESSGRPIEVSEITYYIQKDEKKNITVLEGQNGDVGFASVVCDPAGADISVSDGGTTRAVQSGDKSCTVAIPAPPSTNPVTYTITATDLAGNESVLNVKAILASVDIDVDKSTLTLGSTVKDEGDTDVTGAYYGYTPDQVEKDIGLQRVEGSQTEASSLYLRVVEATLVSDSTNPDSDKFEITGNKPNFKIKPKEKLDVKDSYKAIVAIKYDLVQTESGDILSEHSVNIPVVFRVVKKELTATYVGTTEFYHAKATYQFKDGYDTKPELNEDERWAVYGTENKELAIKVSGFVYGQARDIKTNDSSYKDPSIDGIDTRHNVDAGQKVEKTPGSTNETKGAAKNYKFKYEGGNLTCLRRRIPIGEGYEITGTKGLDIHGNPTGWYTSGVSFKPMTDFEIKDNTAAVTADPPTDALGAQNESGANTYKTTGAADGFSTAGTDYYNETTDAGITKYFYVHNTKTDEISLLMEETIKIDRSAAHQIYTPGPLGPGREETDGALARKPKEERPYLNVNADEWAEFLHTLTFGMYFNARTTVGVNKAIDDKSGIADISYLITDENTNYADKDKEPEYSKPDYKENWKSEIDSSTGWVSIGKPGSDGTSQFNVTKEIADRGYLYVRITNGAGLKTYLTIHEGIIFDDKGPTIVANYDNNSFTPIESGDWHTVEDEDVYIAETVKFRITDTNMMETKPEDSVHTIQVFEGTNISDSSKELTDLRFDYSKSSSSLPHEIVLKCEHYGEHDMKGKYPKTYTIVARDDAKFVTIRYFTIIKPFYEIEMAPVTLNHTVYGSTPTGMALRKLEKDELVGAGWKNTDNANADAIITKLEFDEEGKKYFTTSGGSGGTPWTITPKDGLDAGVYEGTLTVTYKDTDGDEKKLDGIKAVKVYYNVLQKEIIARYPGAVIKRGETPKANVEIDTSGLVNGDTVESAISELPYVVIPPSLKATTVITPQGGKSKNYKFKYVGGIVTVVTAKAEKNTHYTVTGTLSDKGWYISNITLAPKAGYVMCSDADGKLTMNNILITEDTSKGEKSFYIKDSKTGEIFEQCVFTYKKDTVPPVISGIIDGKEYKANRKPVTVTDANLSRVAESGESRQISAGKSEFDLIATQKEKNILVVGEDYAGNMTTAAIKLLQEDGTEETGYEDDDDLDDPDSDKIVDDTDDTDSDLGSFTKKVQLVDGAPATTFTSTNKELKNYVLNSSERTVIKEGSDANVKLRVQDIDGSVSQADKELVIAALGDYTVAKYLDITLWKTVGSGTENQVSSTKKPISMTITIPSGVRKALKSGKKREFALVRIHNGAAAVLEDEDSSANTVTVSSGLFSVYALAYRDVDASSSKSSSSGSGSKDKDSSGGGSKKNSNGGGSGSGGSGYGSVRRNGVSVETDGIVDGSPQTGDHAPILPTALGFGLSLIGMITVVILKKKLDYEWVYVDESGNYYDKRGNAIDPDEIEEMN